LKTLLAAVLVLRGATLIDGTGAPPVSDSLLVVSDGRIVYAGAATGKAAASALASAGSAKVEDVSGRWIVPGLVDAHVHADSDADLVEMLRWGVTSVRLMAEDVAQSAALAAKSRSRSDVPDVFPAAPIFTTKGGWWSSQPPDANLDRMPPTPEAARDSVRKAKALGSREIKLMLDRMAWCRAPLPDLPRLPAPVAAALLDEARRNGMAAIVHAPELADASEAVAAGATALAHGVLEPIGRNGKTLETMKSRPVFYVPTMDIYEFLADPRAFVDSVLADARVTAPGGLAEETVRRYRSAEYSDGYKKRYPNFENVRRKLPALYGNLKDLHAAGVPVALGTDMWAFPGLGVSIEMDLYARAGLTPLEVIRAATSTAARSIGAEKDRGSLSAGKRADFLVLSADPLADVKNVRAIEAVYKAGLRAR
jgi:imidazolonepropionase-like amidohydrolase